MAEIKRSSEDRQPVIFLSNNQKIFGVLHLPILNVQTRCPAVMICHGFLGNKIGTARLFVTLAEYLASSGIACLRFDFRGCGDSEGDSLDLSISGLCGDAQSALNYLIDHPRIDSQQIGLLGSSFGGAISTLLVAKEGCFKTLCLWAPVYDGKDWALQAQHIEKSQTRSSSRLLYTVKGRQITDLFAKEFISLDVTQALASISNCPLCIIHGRLDKEVGTKHMECYLNTRKTAQAETDYLYLERSGHDFLDTLDQSLLLNKTVNWFHNHFFGNA